MTSALAWTGIGILSAITALVWALDIICWNAMPGTAECAYRIALHTW